MALVAMAALRDAIAARGGATLMLCGGRTPEPLYARLAALARDADARGPERALDWSQVDLYFTDERAVPPDDPASNHRLVRDTLVSPAGIPETRVHRMRGERDLEAAASEYDGLLPDALDLVILGLGEDGHVASLFPGSPLITERIRRVAAVTDAPRPPARRLTITPPVLAAARRVFVLATGTGKQAAVALVRAAADPEPVPGRLVRDREWFLDRDAATSMHV